MHGEIIAMDAFFTAQPPRGDEIVRIVVMHGGKRTSVSMDSSVWALLMARVKTHEAARDWVKHTAFAMDVSDVRSPSLSRRIQSAIINSCVAALQGTKPASDDSVGAG